MQRFYCPSQNISGGIIHIADKQQIKHIKNVLRFKAKDNIRIFDGEGYEYQGIISSMHKSSLEVEIEKKEFKEKHATSFSVAVAIPKNVKMDYIVEKLTELGVDTIMPMLTERTIVKLDEKAKLEKVERWRKITISASEQSQRSYLPEISEIAAIGDIFKHGRDYDLCLIPTLSGNRRSLKDVLRVVSKNILVLIGPEGDFTPDEVALAKQAGCIPVSLGDLVLRVETAAIAAVSFMRFYAEG